MSSQLTSNEIFADEARAEYDQNKTGPFTSPTGEFLAFLPLSFYSNATGQSHASALRQNSSDLLPEDTPAEVKQGYQRELEILNERLKANDSAMLELLWADARSFLACSTPTREAVSRPFLQTSLMA